MTKKIGCNNKDDFDGDDDDWGKSWIRNMFIWCKNHLEMEFIKNEFFQINDYFLRK